MRRTSFYTICGYLHLIPTAVKATEVLIKQRYWYIHNGIIPLPKSWHDLHPWHPKAAKTTQIQVQAVFPSQELTHDKTRRNWSTRGAPFF